MMRSTLDWATFETLPGDPKRNFEILTRAAIQHAYGRYGTLRGSRQQPGVEYFLTLNNSCPLGDPPRVYGWQCKYYGDPGHLDGNRREVLANNVETALRHVPGLTDFVLWTKRPVRTTDEAWLLGLSNKVQFHLWHEATLEALLVGDALAVRAAFFGETVVLPAQLDERYRRQLAQIQDRFNPELHVESYDPTKFEASLGDPERWALPLYHSGAEPETEMILQRLLRDKSPYLTDQELDLLAVSLRARHAVGKDAPVAIAEGRLNELLDDIAALPPALGESRFRIASAAAASAKDEQAGRDLGWLWDMEATAAASLSSAAGAFGRKMMAFVGEAGVGKTHLAATLAAPTGERSAGVLVLGIQFAQQLGEAELASLLLPGTTDLDTAIEALDAAAQRTGRRLPIVLDGLNESDDPFRWQRLLTTLRTLVEQRSHLLVVPTVRPDYADRCLPVGVEQIRLAGLAPWRVEEAAEKYFEYYKIAADPDDLSWLTGFERPLMLRIFCEAVNPSRERVVRVEDIPDGQGAVFDLFVTRVLERIGARDRMRDLDHARGRITALAQTLWDTGQRSLSQAEVKSLFGDEEARWDGSLTQQLISEGLLRRDPPPPGVDDPTQQQVSFIFDLLGGHLIGRAVVADPTTQLADPALAERLVVGAASVHPLAQDIVAGIEATLGRQGAVPLWKTTPVPALRRASLLLTLGLPIGQLSDGAPEALAAEISGAPMLLQRVLPRVLVRPIDEADPFNAGWLDGVLRALTVWERDLAWSEGLQTDEEMRLVLDTVDSVLREDELSAGSLRLTASFVSWYLTSTDRALRDHATLLLVNVGLREPTALLDLAIDRLEADDPYITERVMGAAYGLFMSRSFPDEKFLAAASPFLRTLGDVVYGAEEGAGIAHWVTRTHIEGIVAFANRWFPEHVPETLRAPGLKLPAPPAPTLLIEETSPLRAEAEGMFGSDFENYTIGTLSPDRSNYDGDHEAHRTRVAEVLGRAWELGWRSERFEEIDRRLGGGMRPDLDPEQVERYGKKYTWIGYYEAAGRLDSAGALVDEFSGERLRLPDANVDPSFPESPSLLDISALDWVDDEADAEDWVRRGQVLIPEEMLVTRRASENWIAAYGDISQRGFSADPARRVFALLRLLLVPRGEWDAVAADLLSRPSLDRRMLPDAPSDHYTYGGEIPWAAHFARNAEYVHTIRRSSGDEIPTEILAHVYAWEGYHSAQNVAGGTPVPSQPFSKAFGLRTGGLGLDQYDESKDAAAFAKEVPGTERSTVLYLREDLIRRYAEERGLEVGLFVWGERVASFGGLGRSPEWYQDTVRQNANIHRLARSLDQLVNA